MARYPDVFSVNDQSYPKLAGVTECEITPEILERLAIVARPMHGVLGIQTESGEMSDVFKRFVYYGKPIDPINVKEELGDLLWYVALLCNHFGYTLEQVMKANIAKLRVRYGDRFTEFAALNRDTLIERSVMDADRDAGSDRREDPQGSAELGSASDGDGSVKASTPLNV